MEIQEKLIVRRFFERLMKIGTPGRMNLMVTKVNALLFIKIIFMKVSSF